jgi:hypothetical protein
MISETTIPRGFISLRNWRGPGLDDALLNSKGDVIIAGEHSGTLMHSNMRDSKTIVKRKEAFAHI